MTYENSHDLRVNTSKATNCSICGILGNSSMGN